MLKVVRTATCLSVFMFAAAAVFGAPPATQPTLAQRLAAANAQVKAARMAMEAAKAEAVSRYDAGTGQLLVQDLAAKAAAAANAAVLDPQTRMNVLAAHLLAKSELERAHLRAIENDPGVAAATQAVATAHAQREAIRREVDATQANPRLGIAAH